MPLAFVLINAELGSEEEVVEELKKLSNVKEVYVVYGIYDIIVKVEAESLDKLKEYIFSKIRQMRNIRSTLTMVVTSSSSETK
ncbi:MAG: Lrp/AsnC ligand binding domain-containing protein [Candidatus Bathyarchaeia archaeon]